MEIRALNSLDKLDLDILNILVRDCKKPYLEIARMCHVSGGTIHVRMKKMEELGIIVGYNISLDLQKLGFDVCCFAGIFTDNASSLNKIIKELKKINEVTELYLTTSDFDILVKIICKNTSHLQDILINKINRVDGVQRTTTFITLGQRIDRNILLK